MTIHDVQPASACLMLWVTALFLRYRFGSLYSCRNQLRYCFYDARVRAMSPALLPIDIVVSFSLLLSFHLLFRYGKAVMDPPLP